MKLYLSAPISGHDISERRRHFKRLEQQAQDLGYDVVNPLDHCADNQPYESCMRTDIHLILDCDAIWLSGYWESSQGCQVEESVARAIGLTIIRNWHDLVRLAPKK